MYCHTHKDLFTVTSVFRCQLLHSFFTVRNKRRRWPRSTAAVSALIVVSVVKALSTVMVPADKGCTIAEKLRWIYTNWEKWKTITGLIKALIVKRFLLILPLDASFQHILSHLHLVCPTSLTVAHINVCFAKSVPWHCANIFLAASNFWMHLRENVWASSIASYWRLLFHLRNRTVGDCGEQTWTSWILCRRHHVNFNCCCVAYILLQ